MVGAVARNLGLRPRLARLEDWPGMLGTGAESRRSPPQCAHGIDPYIQMARRGGLGQHTQPRCSRRRKIAPALSLASSDFARNARRMTYALWLFWLIKSRGGGVVNPYSEPGFRTYHIARYAVNPSEVGIRSLYIVRRLESPHAPGLSSRIAHGVSNYDVGRARIRLLG